MLSMRDIRTALAKRLANPGQREIQPFKVIAEHHKQRCSSTQKRYEKQGIVPIWPRFANPTM